MQFPKRLQPYLYLLFGVGLVLVIAGCVASVTETPTPTTVSQATDEPTDAPTAVPTEPIAPTPEDEIIDVDLPIGRQCEDCQACLDCHTDTERLQSLAVEEEEASLSSGPG